ncbi:MAG: xanthine dehydrogenase small subunit [Bradymonadia bacterium]|jgi:xanthine dehydrogenase small subunit
MSATFVLNDSTVTLEASDGTLLLDALRQLALKPGTKEGCKEGDCGACAVMIGTPNNEGTLDYQTVTSCLVPLGEVHGKHIVSAEGLRADPSTVGTFDGLNPVQKAIVESGGTQCGFCTPGIAVSLSWWMLADQEKPSSKRFARALSGHLCRCTGYASLERAGVDLVQRFSETGEWAGVWNAADRPVALADAGLLPDSFVSARAAVAQIAPRDPSPEGGTFIAGGTDLYVQRGESLPNADVSILNQYPGMRGIRVDGDSLRIGALTSFEQFAESTEVQSRIPRIQDFMFLIASLQIRNRATLAGNIVNASPIGDMTNFLQALDATLVIDGGKREVRLREFYSGYKIYDLEPGELITEILLDASIGKDRLNFEKLSKRTCLDIATVNSSARLRAEGGTLVYAGIAVGGVAATPLYLTKTSSWLVGREINAETVSQACTLADSEVSPISDIRGSADYKRLLTRQFLIAHFTELYPDFVSFEDLHQEAS